MKSTGCGSKTGCWPWKSTAWARRILQLEQQLASVKAETEELRKRLAAAEQRLTRYRVIEEEILQAGRRVIS
jgi:primosomal protein N''